MQAGADTGGKFSAVMTVDLALYCETLPVDGKKMVNLYWNGRLLQEP